MLAELFSLRAVARAARVSPPEVLPAAHRMLRSEDFGGKGKLSSYAVELRHKNEFKKIIANNKNNVSKEESATTAISIFHISYTSFTHTVPPRPE